jgi:hypothetical protein
MRSATVTPRLSFLVAGGAFPSAGAWQMGVISLKQFRGWFAVSGDTRIRDYSCTNGWNALRDLHPQLSEGRGPVSFVARRPSWAARDQAYHPTLHHPSAHSSATRARAYALFPLTTEGVALVRITLPLVCATLTPCPRPAWRSRPLHPRALVANASYFRKQCAGTNRQEQVGEPQKWTSTTRASPTPGGVHPREGQSLRSVGRLTRRSVGGRVSGPGDRASKRNLSGAPTLLLHAEGQGRDPKSVDVDTRLSPGSKSSARTHQASAREPGDLDEALPAMCAVSGGTGNCDYSRTNGWNAPKCEYRPARQHQRETIR